MDLLGLFAVALVAATLIPAQSEALLAALLLAGDRDPWLLVAVASLGNVLGSVINWMLGHYLTRFSGRKWFPAKEHQLEAAKRWYRRFGFWSLLGSWLPIIGDPLTIVAGALGEPLWRFVVVVGVAKAGRYAVIASTVILMA